MTTRVIDPTGGSKGGGRERAGVFALGGIIVTVVVVYLALNATTGVSDKNRGLLPYQTLAASLPEWSEAVMRIGQTSAEGWSRFGALCPWHASCLFISLD